LWVVLWFLLVFSGSWVEWSRFLFLDRAGCYSHVSILIQIAQQWFNI
jgi:hypothetical protein